MQDANTDDSGAGLPSRAAALEALVKVLEGRSLSEAAPEAFRSLERREEAMARAITMAALKTFHRHEAILARMMSKPARKLRLKAVLHVGLTEILELASPDHAAVNSAVELAKRSKALQPYKNLVNAILRRVLRERDSLASPGAIDCLPGWMAKQWTQGRGADAAERMAAAMLPEPGLDLYLKNPESADALLEAREGIRLGPNTLRLASAAGVEGLPGFREGHWWVQDASAQLPALLFGDLREREVADFCAAPGGKTMQLSSLGARVHAYDASPRRIERIRENLARTGLQAAIEARDLVTHPPARTFDAILLDAPCSATGTLRRNPDVMIHRQPSDIGQLVTLQRNLLKSALGCLKPGGTLIYSVCSLEAAEGEEQIDWLIKEGLADGRALAHKPFSEDELPFLPEAVTEEGYMRILPFMLAHDSPRLAGADGFFAARLSL